MVTLLSAPGLAVFLVARSSFFTWATAGIKPLSKRALHRIRFISDVVLSPGVYKTRDDRFLHGGRSRPMIQEAGGRERRLRRRVWPEPVRIDVANLLLVRGTARDR